MCQLSVFIFHLTSYVQALFLIAELDFCDRLAASRERGTGLAARLSSQLLAQPGNRCKIFGINCLYVLDGMEDVPRYAQRCIPELSPLMYYDPMAQP